MKDLGDYRKSYEKSELIESLIPEDPINLFNTANGLIGALGNNKSQKKNDE